MPELTPERVDSASHLPCPTQIGPDPSLWGKGLGAGSCPGREGWERVSSTTHTYPPLNANTTCSSQLGAQCGDGGFATNEGGGL